MINQFSTITMYLIQSSKKYTILSAQIFYTLNEVDTGTITSEEVFDLVGKIQVVDDADMVIFTGYVTKDVFDLANNLHNYTIASPLDKLKNYSFTKTDTLDSSNFLKELSVPELSIQNYNIDLDQLTIDYQAAGESYLNILRRLGEVRFFDFWFDHEKEVLFCGKQTNTVKPSLEIIKKTTSAENLVNKIYGFSSTYVNFGVDTLQGNIDIIGDYQILKDSKGYFIQDNQSINTYGVIEKVQVTDEFNINNLDNKAKIFALNSSYLVAVSQLLQYKELEIELEVSPFELSSQPVISLGELYEEKYTVRQIVLDYGKNKTTVSPFLSTLTKKRVGVLFLLRRLDAQYRKKQIQIDTQRVSQSFTLDYGKTNEDKILFPKYQSLVFAETYIDITNKTKAQGVFSVFLDGVSIVEGVTITPETTQRFPKILNNSITDKDINFREIEHEISVLSSVDKEVTVSIVFIFQGVLD
jgi:hypothetical protein